MAADARRSRGGLRQIGGYFDPDVVRALKRLAVDRDATQQVLLAEAINDLFEKYGRPRLAEEVQRPRGGAASRDRRGT